jgi:hypothetical protein
MPWQREWPYWVSSRVVEDRRAALEELERASGDLRETTDKAVRMHAVAEGMRRARQRNHFSESMEALFATARSAPTPVDPRKRT